YLCVVRRMSEALTSWKAVATYLGVTVRTAMKWELDRQLPIRRSPGGRVSADPDALAAWQRTQQTPSEHCSFRYLVGNGIIAEVPFLGAPVTEANVELLC